jgi:hypothetical protein
LFLFFVFVVFVNAVSAQISVASNMNSLLTTSGSFLPVAGAAPVSNTKYVELKEGSPFFRDEWANSILVTQEGKAFRDVAVRLNLMENKVHYKDSTGRELVIGVPLREIQLQQTGKGNTQFVNGSILSNAKEGWYQLLVNDSLTLVKGFKKTFAQHTSYGSAPEYTIKTEESYFVYLKGHEFEVSKPADLVKILPAKKAEIEQELKKKNSRLSKDEQLSSIVVYCNELLRKG